MAKGCDGTSLDLRVLEVLISRICHDLVSPVGAVNNGVELIEELGAEVLDDALSLVGESGRLAAARLSCYRLAYGLAGRADGIGFAEARTAAGGYFEATKVHLHWPADEMPPGWNGNIGPKLALNMVILAGEALTHGGTVRVSTGPETLTVRAEGRVARLCADQQRALAADQDCGTMTPRTVHAHLIAVIAQEAGTPVSVSLNKHETVLQIVARTG